MMTVNVTNTKTNTQTFSAFAGDTLLASGDIAKMILGAKKALDAGESRPILIFEDRTGKQVDFDFRGTSQDVLARLASHPLFAAGAPPTAVKRGPGRPKLGVVSREISLLPRHWEWLESQQGGVSATLRRVIDELRKQNSGRDALRGAIEAVGKFMWAMAGNYPNFEEASRALYANDRAQLKELTREWPTDIREYIERRLGDNSDGE